MIDKLSAAITSEDVQAITGAVDQNQLTKEKALYAVVTIIISIIAANIIGVFANKWIGKTSISLTGRKTLVRFLRYIIIGIGILFSLSFIGVNAGWLSIMLGFGGVMAYLTLRPLIENMGAGLLLATRPAFGIGSDVMIKEHRGTVEDINSRSTVIKTRDNMRIHVPNQTVLESNLAVYDGFKERRSELKLTIDYDRPIEEVTKILSDAAASAKRTLKDPAPSTRLKDISQGCYTLKLRWWHKPSLSDESQTRDEVLQLVMEAVTENKIKISLPEAVVDLKK